MFKCGLERSAKPRTCPDWIIHPNAPFGVWSTIGMVLRSKPPLRRRRASIPVTSGMLLVIRGEQAISIHPVGLDSDKDSTHKTLDTRHNTQYTSHKTKFPRPNLKKQKAQDTRHKIHDTWHMTHDTRHKTHHHVWTQAIFVLEEFWPSNFIFFRVFRSYIQLPVILGVLLHSSNTSKLKKRVKGDSKLIPSPSFESLGSSYRKLFLRTNPSS